MKYIGAHVHASGGVENAPLNAHAIGAKAFAFSPKTNDSGLQLPIPNKISICFNRVARS